jgi:hypothetical protein
VVHDKDKLRAFVCMLMNKLVPMRFSTLKVINFLVLYTTGNFLHKLGTVSLSSNSLLQTVGYSHTQFPHKIRTFLY